MAPARKFPAIEVQHQEHHAMVWKRVFSGSVQAANSGRLRRCWSDQYMNAQWADKDSAQHQNRQQRGAANRAVEQVANARLGLLGAKFLAACHSSGSGTLRRIHSTSSAGNTPTRNTRAILVVGAGVRDDRKKEDGEHCQEHSAVDGRLQDGRDPRPPSARPRLRQAGSRRPPIRRRSRAQPESDRSAGATRSGQKTTAR